ncbi:MAG: hypothetical protein M0R48_06435, partial [Candidatus Omnitrophica bacterium]|nr:hypothetical protein [Candidatus Omnitrophota bacterium]
MKKALLLVILLGLSFFRQTSLFAEPSKAEIKTTKDGGYYLTVDNKPFLIKGIIYNPTPICKGYDYEFFTDTNKQWLIDGKLMKEAGIHCVR